MAIPCVADKSGFVQFCPKETIKIKVDKAGRFLVLNSDGREIPAVVDVSWGQELEGAATIRLKLYGVIEGCDELPERNS